MAKLDEHPTVIAHRQRETAPAAPAGPLDAAELRALCLEQGADDVGFVELGRPELAEQQARILGVFPRTRTLISFCCRVHRESVRSPTRSVSNHEFHQRMAFTNGVGRKIAVALAARGHRALSVPGGYPMELDNFPDEQPWVISHKPVAVAAGLGHMGRHRLVTHARHGAFILLGTVLVDAEVTAYGQPLGFDPCLECQYCVAVCPVGAVGADGVFNFAACLTHCYHDNLGGFIDWSERVAAGGDRAAFRRRLPDGETVALWQSLTAGPSYRTSYCMAVCPAGEDVVGPFLADRQAYLQEVVKPLQALPEKVFVTVGSDAEAHVVKRFPHKRVRRVENGTRPQTVAGFVQAARFVFQRQRSEGLAATYHFTFTGAEDRQATMVIKDKQITVEDGLVGTADVAVTADSETWVGVLAKERSVLWAIATRRVRVKGPVSMFKRFAACFA